MYLTWFRFFFFFSLPFYFISRHIKLWVILINNGIKVRKEIHIDSNTHKLMS